MLILSVMSFAVLYVSFLTCFAVSQCNASQVMGFFPDPDENIISNYDFISDCRPGCCNHVHTSHAPSKTFWIMCILPVPGLFWIV